MRLLLGTMSSNPEWDGECDYAVVDIDSKLLTLIEKRMLIFSETKLKDSSLYEMYFWDWTPDFFYLYYSLDDTSFEEKIEEILNKEGMCDNVWKISRNIKIPKDAFQRVECTQMIINEDSVSWVTIPKNSSMYITTERIPYSLLKI